jgi:hypothetical protein
MFSGQMTYIVIYRDAYRNENEHMLRKSSLPKQDITREKVHCAFSTGWPHLPIQVAVAPIKLVTLRERLFVSGHFLRVSRDLVRGLRVR